MKQNPGDNLLILILYYCSLYKQDWVENDIKRFEQSIFSLKQFFCENCNELWPNENNKCEQCAKNIIKYSKVIFHV